MRLMVVVTLEEEDLPDLKSLVNSIKSGYIESVHCAIDMDKELLKQLKEK